MQREYDFQVSLPSLRLSTCAISIVLTLVLVMAQASFAQTYQVIYNFSGGADGATPTSGVTIDAAGNFYGTTSAGGSHGLGVVYKLLHRSSGWILTPLYSFQGVPDGSNPAARVVFGPDGALYGTTSSGGTGGGNGTVFRLTPPATFCAVVFCSWSERVLYSFTGFPSDGINPQAEVVFDRSGNLYGTTVAGGTNQGGIAYEITAAGLESTVHNFSGDLEGAMPYAPLTLDADGHLYGTASEQPRFGLVYELARLGTGWIGIGLFNFYSEDVGSTPLGGLIFDPQGNLYGTASDGGPNGGGVIFELEPSQDGWTYHDLYDLPGTDQGPNSTLLRDASGDLYGTTTDNFYNFGEVFKLSFSGGVWTYTILHTFTGGSDGGLPYGPLVMDTHGNLYGTAGAGGGNPAACRGQGCGVIFEITP